MKPLVIVICVVVLLCATEVRAAEPVLAPVATVDVPVLAVVQCPCPNSAVPGYVLGQPVRNTARFFAHRRPVRRAVAGLFSRLARRKHCCR